MKKLLTATIIALLSCGTQPERLISTDSIYTVEGFADGYLGYCRSTIPPDFKKHMIVIDREYADVLDISYEIILLHELGHCQFGLDHVEATFFDDGCVREIMATLVFPEANSNKCFEKHKTHYMNQYRSWKACDTISTCPVKNFIW